MKLILVVVLYACITCAFTNRGQDRAKKRNEKKSKKEPQNRQYAVNEGASTSRGTESAVDKIIQSSNGVCDIDDIVKVAVQFMISRSESYDGDLKKMVKEKQNEMIIISKRYMELMNKITPGSSFQNDRTAPYFEARRKEYDRKLDLKINEEWFRCASSDNYRFDHVYKVDLENMTVKFLPPRITENLCDTDVAKKELEIFEEDLKKRKKGKDKGKKSRPRKIIPPDTSYPGPSTINNPQIADHHIIKQSLIKEFLDVPAGLGEFDIARIATTKNKNWKVLMLRMRNHFKIVEIGRYAFEQTKLLMQRNVSNNVDIERLVNDNYLAEIKRRSKFWSHTGGNIFRGPLPSLRGPFDPFLWKDKYVFEEDSEPIIGKKHAKYSRWVSENLKKFLEEHHKMNDNDKALKKSALMDQLNFAMENFDLTPYNPDQWELVIPTDADLDRLKNQQSRKIFENKKYWKIKQTNPESTTERKQESGSKSESEREFGTDSNLEPDASKRSKRSVTDSENKVEYAKLNEVVRQQWTEFVLVSLRDHMEADSSNQSLEWSNDMKNLFNQYEFENWTNILCANSTTGFDQFLYSKMFFDDGWIECIVSNKTIDNRINKELCSASRRIILNTDSLTENILLDKSLRPQQFLKDRTTVWKELNQIPAIDQVPKTNVMIEEKIMSNEKVNLHSFSNVINAGSIVLSFISYIPCNKHLLTRVKRDVNIFNELYAQEWFLDTSGSLKCL